MPYNSGAGEIPRCQYVHTHTHLSTPVKSPVALGVKKNDVKRKKKKKKPACTTSFLSPSTLEPFVRSKSCNTSGNWALSRLSPAASARQDRPIRVIPPQERRTGEGGPKEEGSCRCGHRPQRGMQGGRAGRGEKDI